LTACSLEAVQSTRTHLDLCGATSPTLFTTTDTNSPTHDDKTGGCAQTASLIVMPTATPPPPPYHAVAGSLLPPVHATSSLVGYMELITHQPRACVNSPPPSLQASHNCLTGLTTKIRGGHCLALASTKFTPYWVSLTGCLVWPHISLNTQPRSTAANWFNCTTVHNDSGIIEIMCKNVLQCLIKSILNWNSLGHV